MYGLVDCNNFFVSCERVFRPDLNNKPVVVLSNNDGCVVSRSNEAKRIGIRMGCPAFEIKSLIDTKKVYAFSSNYTLYGDMSSRIMNIMADLSPSIEIYSIDEAFINLGGIENLEEFSRKLVKEVIRGTGVPVSMGVAPTKTLAKIANSFAKKYSKYNRVCVIDSDNKRVKALQLTEIRDVWGVGRRNAKKLEFDGIYSAYDFVRLNRREVRKKMTVIGERMWRELNGEPCLLEEHNESKKQICNSRSFEKMLGEYDDLAQAVSYHAANCAKQLRKQKSCGVSLLVFIYTNRFRDDLPQYSKHGFIELPVPTSDTLEIVQYALRALKKIFVSGFLYKKAGVVVMEVVPQNSVQTDIFDKKDRAKSDKLMKVIDDINGYYNDNTVKLAVNGLVGNWRMKREMLSPSYTTRIEDIIKIKC